MGDWKRDVHYMKGGTRIASEGKHHRTLFGVGGWGETQVRNRQCCSSNRREILKER